MPRVHANEIDIEFESFGRDKDPCLLLIMGFGAPLTVWPRTFCEALAARGFRVVRYDNRDAGKSTYLMNKGDTEYPRDAGQDGGGRACRRPLPARGHGSRRGRIARRTRRRARACRRSFDGRHDRPDVAIADHPRRTKSLVSIMSTTGRRDLPQPKPETMGALTMPPASTSREDRIAAESDRAVDSSPAPAIRGPMESFARWPKNSSNGSSSIPPAARGRWLRFSHRRRATTC